MPSPVVAFTFTSCGLTPSDGAKQLKARGVAVAGVVVRKKLADVAGAQRSEKRVAERVAHRIGVRVAEQPPFPGYLHSAQNEPSARHQTMPVDALPDAVSHPRG